MKISSPMLAAGGGGGRLSWIGGFLSGVVFYVAAHLLWAPSFLEVDNAATRRLTGRGQVLEQLRHAAANSSSSSPFPSKEPASEEREEVVEEVPVAPGGSGGLSTLPPALVSLAAAAAGESAAAAAAAPAAPAAAAAFKRCALVASPTALKGSGRGPEIDGHDTVIRLSWPSRAAEATTGQGEQSAPSDDEDDVGTRTDVVVASACDVTSRAPAKSLQTACCSAGHPEQESRKNGTSPSCPLSSVVLLETHDNKCVTPKRLKELTEFFSRTICVPAALAASDHGGLAQALRDLTPAFRGEATVPFKAFVLMGSTCETLTMYGLASDTVTDEQRRSLGRLERMRLNREKATIRAVVSGMLPAGAWPEVLRSTLRVKASRGDLKVVMSS